MTAVEWGLFAAAVIVVSLLACWIGRNGTETDENAWRPQELQDAEIAYAEQMFRSNGQVSVVAKVDRAYRDRNGLITIVELKTRQVDRVYLSDIIELSAQRFALEAQTREPVAPYGYVLIQQKGYRERKLHRVRLLTRAELITLVAHREAILAGDAEARHTIWPRLCRHCAFKQECKPPADFSNSKISILLGSRSLRIGASLCDRRIPARHNLGAESLHGCNHILQRDALITFFPKAEQATRSLP
ncbi:PD-(D/E)XK nuclease family protein [Noviherbaspirillum sp. ST9]|uniref:PD-(D/E)XK nuclease family protein n=1 Tax=Noviherbaspirillum sp. ST9 TaxID=3401606 RepID=UPI003B589D07